MRHGSLFAGIGGFDLGFQRAGIETVWQVEIDDYCRKVLAQHFPEAERFSDIRDCGAHNLKPVDIISGGFPCQDISVAGKQVGITGSRSGLWSEMHRIISELRPRFAVIENVPNLARLGLDRVLADLASIGYDAEWQCISANDVGAPHLRRRIWIVAYPQRSEKWDEREVFEDGTGSGRQNNEGQRTNANHSRPGGEDVAYTSAIRRESDGELATRQHSRPEQARPYPEQGGKNVAYTESGNVTRVLSVPGGESRKGSGGETDRGYSGDRIGDWWSTEPDVGRVAHGIPSRVDRLKGLGNAIIPQIAEIIGRLI